MNPAAVKTIQATNAPDSNMGTLSAILYPGVTLEHASIDENGRTGSESSYIYSGSYLALKGQQSWCRGWGAYNMSLSRVEGSHHWRLQAVFPFNENGGEANSFSGTNGVYELDVEMQQPSVYVNDVLRGRRDGLGNQITSALLPDNYIAAVARVVENFEAGDYSMTASGGGTDAGWSAAVADIKAAITSNVSPTYYQNRALQLFATVAAHKTDAFIEYYHVFKRTITAALPIQVQASNVGKGMIWTTYELQNWENIAANGFFQLDQNSLWLKSPPSITASARQKTQVTYSYTEFRQANGLLYLPYGNASLMFASPTDLPPNV